MPGLVRKLIVLAAVDGLVLQPLAPWNTRGAPSVHIAYETHAVTRLSQAEAAKATAVDKDDEERRGLEAHAIVGLLQIASAAYLIAVSRREQVAQLWNKPVYSITDVAFIPISSQQDAESAITRAARSATGDAVSDDESDQEQVAHLDEDWLDDLVLHGQEQTHVSRSRRGSMKEPSVAEDVIGRKGAYGRFSGGWFSRTGWLSGQRKNMGLRNQDDLLKPSTPVTGGSAVSSPVVSPSRPENAPETLRLDQANGVYKPKSDEVASAVDQRVMTLVPKLVSTAKLLLSSKTFFFAYDHDITHRLSDQALQPTDTPLHRRVEPQYYWNHHLAAPLVAAGLDEYILPIMQGFVGQRAFSITSALSASSPAQTESVKVQNAQVSESSTHTSNFLVTLISRRSICRSGLRYLRRGIDEEGNVANAVETEQILCSPTWDHSFPVQSFVQARGSIPLFFTQTPYNLKPIPSLHGSPEANARAMRMHFQALSKRYGFIHAISLVNGHGNEEKIGAAYESAINNLNEQGGVDSRPVGFEWFDFHTVCKGMKFENVSQLLDSTKTFLDTCGWSTLASGEITRRQEGVMRVNCMDCLDRTNVVQSSFAERILSEQLSGLLKTPIDLRSDPSTTWLATLWADNGDAVSLAYTSTAALKGDFVRTRRRNVFGLLTDLSLTLSRYYHNLFEDFFVQSALDYMLGNVNAGVFADFEAGVRGADLSVDVNRVRREAIDTCTRHLLQTVEGAEEVLGGWAMAAPADGASSSNSDPQPVLKNNANKVMYEVILLLTDRCIARVSYDWETERVGDVSRVPLEKITSLQWGTWICDTLSAAQMDEARNVGLVIVYDRPEHETGVITDSSKPRASVGTLAFKALPTRSAVLRPEQQDTAKLGERDLVQHVCEEIVRTIGELQSEVSSANGPQNKHLVEIVEKDIVSLEQARKNTGYIDQLSHSLRKIIWG